MLAPEMMDQPTPTETVEPALPRICAVKFRNAGRTFDYDTAGMAVKRGDLVLVEFGEAEVVATVSRASALTQAAPGTTLPKLHRVLGEADAPALELIAKREAEAFKFALVKLRARNLPAKMVAAELSFHQDRLTFYVASEDRLDLRAWIRDLSTEFRARIDIRQIGARDAAKFIGGIGSCGRELCCSTWLVEFRPVSIKMAKDQNLALNPEKVSGQCGRLLCCLTYEQDTYRDMRKGLPKVGKRVYTPLGDGRVKDVNVLRRKVRVQLVEGYEEFDADQVSPMFGQKGELLQPNFGAPAAFEDDEDGEDGAEAKADAPVAAKPTPAPTPRPPGDRPQGDRPPRDGRPGGDRGPRPQSDARPQGGDRGPRPQGDRGPRPQGDRGPRPQGDARPQGGDRGPRRNDRGPRNDRPRDQQPPRVLDQPAQPADDTRKLPLDTPAANAGIQTPRRIEEAKRVGEQEDLDDGPDAGPDDGPEETTEAGAAPQLGPDGQPRRKRRRRRRGRGGRGGGGGGTAGGAPPAGGGGGAPPP